MQAILVAGVAPYIVTSAGVLMPVVAFQTSHVVFQTSRDAAEGIALEYLRLRPGNGVLREWSKDGVLWLPIMEMPVDALLQRIKLGPSLCIEGGEIIITTKG